MNFTLASKIVLVNVKKNDLDLKSTSISLLEEWVE